MGSCKFMFYCFTDSCHPFLLLKVTAHISCALPGLSSLLALPKSKQKGRKQSVIVCSRKQLNNFILQ